MRCCFCCCGGGGCCWLLLRRRRLLLLLPVLQLRRRRLLLLLLRRWWAAGALGGGARCAGCAGCARARCQGMMRVGGAWQRWLWALLWCGVTESAARRDPVAEGAAEAQVRDALRGAWPCGRGSR